MQQERLLFGALQSIKAGSRSIQRMAMSRPLRGLTDLALPGKFLASGAREKGLPFRQVALSALGRPSSAGLSWRDGWVFRPGKLSFSSAPVRRSKKELDSEEEEGVKRMASDDPSQLPDHFFNKASVVPPSNLGFFGTMAVRLTIPVLIKMSEDAFEEDDFLEGSKAAFDHIMELWTQGSHEGFESLMSEAMLRAFKDTHDEYKKHNVEMDYVSRPCESAQIMRVQFMQDETTEKDLAWVDVQFVNEQRITLRDSTGKVIGDEGEFTKKAITWRFQTELPALKWTVVDIPE